MYHHVQSSVHHFNADKAARQLVASEGSLKETLIVNERCRFLELSPVRCAFPDQTKYLVEHMIDSKKINV